MHLKLNTFFLFYNPFIKNLLRCHLLKHFFIFFFSIVKLAGNLLVVFFRLLKFYPVGIYFRIRQCSFSFLLFSHPDWLRALPVL